MQIYGIHLKKHPDLTQWPSMNKPWSFCGIKAERWKGGGRVESSISAKWRGIRRRGQVMSPTRIHNVGQAGRHMLEKGVQEQRPTPFTGESPGELELLVFLLEALVFPRLLQTRR